MRFFFDKLKAKHFRTYDRFHIYILKFCERLVKFLTNKNSIKILIILKFSCLVCLKLIDKIKYKNIRF